MSTKPANKISISLPPIELPQSVYDQLKASSGLEDPTPKILSWVKYLLSNQAAGGMTLTPAEVKRIEDVAGETVSSGRNIVDIASKAAGRQDGQYNFNVQLDPVYISPAEDTARAQGVTLDMLVNDAINTSLENGWLYSWTFDGLSLRVPASRLAELKAFTGKEKPTGTDLMNAITGAKE